MTPADVVLAPKPETKGLDQLAIDTIRALAIDAVEKASSGHSRRAHGHGPDRTPCGTNSCATIRPAHCGPTETGSCFRPATARCCSMR